jgi:hypothetical protein
VDDDRPAGCGEAVDGLAGLDNDGAPGALLGNHGAREGGEHEEERQQGGHEAHVGHLGDPG